MNISPSFQKNDAWGFLRAWARNPKKIGAVMPSGASLARLMTGHVNGSSGPIIELGPGTGAFTRALFAQGISSERLALVEANDDFANALSRRYPNTALFRMDAARLGDVAPVFGNELAGTVISGLPLLSMPGDQVEAIIRGIFDRQLRADGTFYQFTYGRRCPLSAPLLARLNLCSQRVGSVMFNFPPATVYRITRGASLYLPKPSRHSPEHLPGERQARHAVHFEGVQV